jgi:succinate dehydrogenase/fumarate reductase-like Fe-S protein
MKNRLIAWLNLAYRFGVHVTVRVPARALGLRADYERFLHTVSAEGYVPLPAEDRARFPDFMQCIHCGLCTLACPAMREAPASAWGEAWTFVAGTSRSLERAPLAGASLTPCAKCSECEAACPTGVPITLLVETIERLAREAGRPHDVRASVTPAPVHS